MPHRPQQWIADLRGFQWTTECYEAGSINIANSRWDRTNESEVACSNVPLLAKPSTLSTTGIEYRLRRKLPEQKNISPRLPGPLSADLNGPLPKSVSS